MELWRKLDEHVAYARYRRILSRRFALPGGGEIEYEVYDDPDTAFVLALTPGGEAVLVRQFRPGPETALLEVPGGLVESGSTPAETAALELREETGYSAELRPAGRLVSSSYSTQTRHVFVATGARRAGNPAPGEHTETVLLPVPELRDRLRNGGFGEADIAYLALDVLNLL